MIGKYEIPIKNTYINGDGFSINRIKVRARVKCAYSLSVVQILTETLIILRISLELTYRDTNG